MISDSGVKDWFDRAKLIPMLDVVAKAGGKLKRMGTAAADPRWTCYICGAKFERAKAGARRPTRYCTKPCARTGQKLAFAVAREKKAAIALANCESGVKPSNPTEAEAIGSKYYWTGRPCPNGHASERFTSNQACAVCVTDRKAKNRVRLNECARLRYAASIERSRKKSRDSERSRWLKNPDKMRDQSRVSRSHRRARIRLAEGHHTAADIRRIRKDQRGHCAACREKLGRSPHLDHIVPLARGGSNWPSNLQWLCPTCNSSKNARDPIAFMQALGRLL